MDVSATGQAVAAAVPQSNAPTVTGTVAPPSAPASSAAPNAEHTQSNSAQGAANSSALAPAIAKLFNIPAPPDPIRLDVSYRVERDPNVIVTVFSDPNTGQEVAQFPPEILINLAQFFDQPTGATLDKNA